MHFVSEASKHAKLNEVEPAIRKEIRRIAVDANFHDKYCADYPHAVQASKDRKKFKAHAV